MEYPNGPMRDGYLYLYTRQEPSGEKNLPRMLSFALKAGRVRRYKYSYFIKIIFYINLRTIFIKLLYRIVFKSAASLLSTAMFIVLHPLPSCRILSPYISGRFACFSPAIYLLFKKKLIKIKNIVFYQLRFLRFLKDTIFFTFNSAAFYI